MKWEKALKYTRKHKRMIAVMMAGVIGICVFLLCRCIRDKRCEEEEK
mgnify:CR=1 FL=1